jgi:integrase
VSTKRGNGEGSISKRKDGRWMARYTVQTSTGPKRKTLYGKTRAEVAEKLTKAMADRDGGIDFDVEKITFGEYLERWLSDSVRGSVKERTLMSYEQMVRNHLVPALGHVQLRKLTAAHLQALYRQKLEDGFSAQTVLGIHGTASGALK